MPELILGPILRYAGPTEATVWVETDSPAEVGILDARSQTFCVAGHHYALLILEGLEPGSRNPYSVSLDGQQMWPGAGEREGLIRTPDNDNGRLKLAFGSCRVSVPHEPPFVYTKDRDSRGREVDSLAALAVRMTDTSEEDWPDALLLLGDQVYADEVNPDVAGRIEERRSTDTGAGEEIADFEEYTWLYHYSWGDPAIRWLLSSLPSAMIFDDHDVIDDWNISGTWIKDQRKKDWWRERILGAFMSYWIYQHLGNLSPGELRDNETLAEVRAHRGDAEPILRELAADADREGSAVRWSYHRDFGRTRLVVLDSRAGRSVDDDSSRQMLFDHEWDWATDHLSGDLDHLLVASSVPVLMSPGLHHLEAWNEALCARAWGRFAVRPSERLRQALDLEHWPAFRHCFDRLLSELRAVGAGDRGHPPASMILLSGDVHHAYLAEAQYPVDDRVKSRLVQAVCSPMRNPLGSSERHAMKAALSRPGSALARLLSRAAGVPRPRLRWRFVDEPTFDNQIGTVEINGRESVVRIERTVPDDWRRPGLHESLDYRVS